MITNERHYRTAIAAIRSLEDALANFDLMSVIKMGVDPMIAKAQVASYEVKLRDLVEQVAVYDKVRLGVDTNFDFSSISQLGEHLIGCRVARGWTQKRLGEILGLKEQQVQRYERERYATISLSRLANVAEALGVKISGLVEVAPPAQDAAAALQLPTEPSVYPLSVMNARGWLGQKLDLKRSTPNQKIEALTRFLAPLSQPHAQAALYRKTAAPRDMERHSALLAWQARILWLAKQRKTDCKPYTKLNVDALRQLVQLSKRDDGPAAAVAFLREHGVIVVFESHLPKTKLDGAAMVLDGRYAVIGMTVRHDRIDNFWFVLLHEIAHLMLHWGPLLRQGFIDEEPEKAHDGLEREANDFARNLIVSDEVWNSSFVRYSQTPQVLKEFAAKHSIHEALVAGRVRFERSDYKIFNDMVGSGQVKSNLIGTGLLQEVEK